MICLIVRDGHAKRIRFRRAGLSLLEVVISLAILLMSSVAIAQLISLANERANDVQREAQGSLLCQRKLAEAIIGPSAPGATSYTDFPEDEALDGWQWKMDVTSNIDGLYDVQVSVKFDGGDGSSIEVQLGQMILDPTIRGSNLDPRATQGTGSSSSSSTTPSTTTPSATTPSATTPSSNKATTPSASAPSSNKTTTPSTTTPSSNKATTPSATTPSTTTPSSSKSTTGKGG